MEATTGHPGERLNNETNLGCVEKLHPLVVKVGEGLHVIHTCAIPVDELLQFLQKISDSLATLTTSQFAVS